MSQRAAWQLERLGFTDVHDFVVGKAHWLASGRPTEGSASYDRVGAHLRTDMPIVGVTVTVAEARRALTGTRDDRVVVVNAANVVLGSVSKDALDSATASTPVADVMKVGPTTIRPDEDTTAVSERMTRHNVGVLVVTATTGQLLGYFDNPANVT